MSMTLTIEIPALDRLCAWLDGRDKAGLLEVMENEIVAKLEEAAKSGVPKPEFKDIERPENAPVERIDASLDTLRVSQRDGAGRPLGTGNAAAAPEPEKPSSVTLADVQQACARLRDAGKMNEVKALFPEFGIKKLSDLKGADQLAAFAARLKKLEG